MKQTDHYHLNLIEGSDSFLPDPLNQNAAVIDATLNQLQLNLTRMAVGTYVGAHVYGAENPNVVEVSFTPKFLLVWTTTGLIHGMAALGQKMRLFHNSSSSTIHTNEVTWGENFVSWYSTVSLGEQLNSENYTYHYLVLG